MTHRRKRALILLLAILLAAGGEAGGKSPWQPHLYRMYGFGMSHTWVQSPDAIADRGVNMLYLKGAYSDLFFQWTSVDTGQLVEPRKETRRKIAAFHDKGIKVMAGMALVPRYFPTNMEIPADMLGHFVRDRTGKIYPNKPKWEGYKAIWLCVNHDYWLKPFVGAIKKQIEMGFDCTHVDLANAVICYCDVCRAKWQGYSKKNLGRAISIEEAVRADRVYLRRNRGKAIRSDDNVVAAHYKAYRYECVIEFFRKVQRELDTVAPQYGIDTTNHMWDRSMYFWAHGRDAFDTACIEITTAQPGWFPPEGEAISSYRLCLASLGPNHTAWGLNKMLIPVDNAIDPGITMEDASTADRWVSANPGQKWQRLNPSADRQRLYLAEGLIEGVMVNPQSLNNGRARQWGTKPIPYNDIIKAYYDFQRDVAGKGRSAAKVVVLFSVADAVFDTTATAKPAFYGLCEILLKSHIPYDVRVLEHPDEIEADRYDAFLVPSGKCISDAALEFLAKRASEGKMVMASEGLGERTEVFRPRGKSLPRPLDKVKGFDLDLPSELGPFNKSKLSAEARKLAEVIGERTQEQITVDHPQADRLASKLVRTDKGMLLHILNFNIPTFPTLSEREQLVKEAAVPAKDVKITLKLERGEKVKDVRGLSPDHEAVAIPFKQEGDMVSFIVPEVEVWEMVEVAW